MASEVRRDRPLRTCHSCRRRKIGCDKVRPSCSQCRKASLACTYEDELPQRVDFQFIAEAPGSSEPRTPSLVNLNNRAGPLQPNLSPFPRDELSILPKGHLSLQPGNRLRFIEPTYWAYDPDDEDTVDTLLGDQTRFDVFDSRETLELERPGTASAVGTSSPDGGQRSSFSGTSGGQASAGQRVTLPYRLTGDLASPPPAFRQSDVTTSRYQRRASTTLLGSLPPKMLCDRLLEIFLTGWHPVVSFIHMPTFRTEYAKVWRVRSSGTTLTQETSHNFSLVIAVLFVGSVVCPDVELLRGVLPEKSQTLEELQKTLHQRASQALRQASFPRTPSLETLRAYLLIQTIWIRYEEPLSTVPFVGIAYRAAQMIGLHRDPSDFPSIQPIEAELRRRVWWFIVYVDTIIAFASGLPLLIDNAASSVWPVSELKEELIGTPEALQYETQLRQIGARNIRSTLDSSIAVNRELLSLVYGVKAVTPQDLIAIRAKIKLVVDDLKARINKIPSSPRRTLSNSHTHDTAASERQNSNFDSWARLTLSELIDRTWQIACHPALKSVIHKVFGADIESKALKHCGNYLVKVAQLSCFEEFQYFHWNWPGQHQPLLPLMIVLTDLRKRPRSSEASSFREIVDIVFALCGPGGGLVTVVGGIVRQRPLTEGGTESWELLWRCRQRAWRAAGLDPNMLWTREQAVENLYASYDQAQHEDPPVSTLDKTQPTTEAAEGFDPSAASSSSWHASTLPDARLDDPNIPMPNLDVSFWDQMIDEHGQMDLDIGSYGNLDSDFPETDGQ